MLGERAKAVLQELTEHDKQVIRRMNTFGRDQFLTEKFGNESERFGISFGLFPLWVREVLDELQRSDCNG